MSSNTKPREFRRCFEYMDVDVPLEDDDAHREQLMNLAYPCPKTIWTKYNQIRRVGLGTYGEVFKASSKTDPTKIVAVKKMTNREQEAISITTLREINILKAVRHENVVELIEVCNGESNYSNHFISDTYLVFEFCDNDLSGLLSKTTGSHKVMPLNEGHRKSIMKQLFAALLCLHTNQILHRDLKPANILITRNGVLKVADFGLAKSISAISGTSTPDMVTIWYRAPEIMLGDKHYNFPVDMWSAGCIMAEMYSDGVLFKGRTDQHQLKLIGDLCGPIDETSWPAVTKLPLYNVLEFNKNTERTLKRKFRTSTLRQGGMDLLDGLLVLDPEKRMNADTACVHDYFWTGAEPGGLKELLARLGNNSLDLPVRLARLEKRKREDAEEKRRNQ